MFKKGLYIFLILSPSVFAFGGNSLKALDYVAMKDFVERGFISITESYDKERLSLLHSFKKLEIEAKNSNVNRKAKADKDDVLAQSTLLDEKVDSSGGLYPKKQKLEMNINFYNSTDKTVKRLDIYFYNDASFDNISDNDLAFFPEIKEYYVNLRANKENEKLSDNEIWQKLITEIKPDFIKRLNEKNSKVLISIDTNVKPNTVGNVIFMLPFKDFTMSSWRIAEVWVD